MKISYNWLQDYFEEKLPTPEKISEAIIFHSFEVESIERVANDTILDIKILPDRAHDCLSHWGIAKELSAIFDIKIKERKYKIFTQKDTKLNIKIEDKKCVRYMGRIMNGVKVEESPKWLKEKLNAIGQKSINNIVDAANFIMFDLGQPIHCFDLNKLENSKIIIRNGKIGEKINTLDKKEINLDESILVIADEYDPLAIAGIKGGVKAEVDFNTENIIIEVANFDPISTRKTSKKIGILTDAVKRYENEISPILVEYTMNAISNLIWELTGAEAEDIVDVYPIKAEQKEVSVSTEYINKRLGTIFTKEEIKSVWGKLNFSYKEDGSVFMILVPLLRIDIKGPHDLAEEVARILGYEKIIEELPRLDVVPKINETFSKILFARNKLLNEGYGEVMTYTFSNSGEVEVLASASDKNFLRNNLTDGLKESLELNRINAHLLELDKIKIFEIGTVFLKNKEEIHIAYSDNKNIIEISLDEFCQKAVPFFNKEEYLYGNYTDKKNDQKFKAWSVYPFITRDVAVWIPKEEDSSELVDLLKKEATDLLIREPYIFDSFTKQNRISYGFRLVFQSYNKTLTDDEINIIMVKISNKIRENPRWELR